MMDSDIWRWILEFLLIQPLEGVVLDSLFQVFPIPNGSPHLKKSIILRKIESEVSRGDVSEKILRHLELIEELGHSQAASVSLKAAYCAVAVDCTVRYLKNGLDGRAKYDYFDAVRRIWKERVCIMEKHGNIALVSEELLAWRDDIESAVWDDNVCEDVLKRSINAVEVVKAYVNEEKEAMGPSFLEFVFETFKEKGKDGDVFWGLIGLGKNVKDDTIQEKGTPLPTDDTQVDDTNLNKEVQSENVSSMLHTEEPEELKLVRRKRVAHRRTRGAKIAHVDGDEEVPSHNKYNVLPTPLVNKVQEALDMSRLELQGVVKDPLPDALVLADQVSCGLMSKAQEPRGENQNTVVINDAGADQSGEEKTGNEGCSHQTNVPKSSLLERNNTDHTHEVIFDENRVNNDDGAPKSRKENVGDEGCSHQANVPKLNLMERNNTAHTFEWDDSIDGSSSPLPDRLPPLPSPKRKPVSPLKEHKIQHVAKRRKPRRWSNLEEETLRTGVKKYGAGNWKFILNAYGDKFDHRTEVDLKDKWRNLVSRGAH